MTRVKSSTRIPVSNPEVFIAFLFSSAHSENNFAHSAAVTEVIQGFGQISEGATVTDNRIDHSGVEQLAQSLRHLRHYLCILIMAPQDALRAGAFQQQVV